jgi:hypothetical protein
MFKSAKKTISEEGLVMYRINLIGEDTNFSQELFIWPDGRIHMDACFYQYGLPYVNNNNPSQSQIDKFMSAYRSLGGEE